MSRISTPAASPATAPPPPASWRWAVLVAISVAMFGNYYAYDSIGPLADSLQRLLGFSDTQIGTLNAIYSLPNIVMVLIGGIIVDRYGTRLSTLLFALLCLAGTILTAISPSFPLMAAGRLVFGLGAESMIVAITVAIGQWFVGRQLGFAFGVNLSIARAGSYSADLSTTWFKPCTTRAGSRRCGWPSASVPSPPWRASCTTCSSGRLVAGFRWRVPSSPNASSGATCFASIVRIGTSWACV